MENKANITPIVSCSSGTVTPPAEGQRPNPEVGSTIPRRQFTARYKLRILRAVDACQQPGEIGALLRREGLYHSHIQCWRRQMETGAFNGLTPKQRGRKKNPVNPQAEELVRLQKEIQRLERKLKQAEIIIDVQKKISDILSIHQDVTPGGNR
jgi:transposase-like protein